MTSPRPIILDTDIGTDVDDTWALGMLLQSPALDLRLVVTSHGDTRYRARVAARFLEVTGRGDVPVGVGVAGEALAVRPQEAFARGFELEDYKGPVFEDGVGALLSAVAACEEPPTIVSIGPLTNIAAALERDPSLAERARLVGMHGAVRKGYKGSAEVAPEYNVYCDIAACRRAFSAGWPVTITPLDTCGLVRLAGERYRRVREAPGAIPAAVIENYRAWLEAIGAPAERLEQKSTTLYDTVAVSLAEGEAFLEVEELGIRVDDEGYTRIDPSAPKLRVATGWSDFEGFHDRLVERLCA